MIVVVGGSGFLGTSLCRLLDAAGEDFLIVDKRRSESFPKETCIADVRDQRSLESAIPEGTSVLVNLAAEHRDDVSPASVYHDVNVLGAENLCSVMRNRNVGSCIFTSSVAVYGFAPPGTKEDGNISPFNEYGITKAAAERVFQRWQSENTAERSLTIVRPAVVFGEGNRGNVFNLLSWIARGRFALIGSGENVKSMAYVGNVTAFLRHVMDSGAGLRIFNYVDSPQLSMKELVALAVAEIQVRRKPIRIPYFIGASIGAVADLISLVSGRKFAISRIRVRKFCATTHFESAAREAGFVPPYGLVEGLQRTMQYEFGGPHPNGQVFYTE